MPKRRKGWSLLSRHGQALVVLAKNPNVRVLELAKLMGISERSVRLLLNSLHRSKILRVQKDGRNNTYEVDCSLPSPHELERSISLQSIVDLADISPSALSSSVKAPLR